MKSDKQNMINNAIQQIENIGCITRDATNLHVEALRLAGISIHAPFKVAPTQIDHK